MSRSLETEEVRKEEATADGVLLHALPLQLVLRLLERLPWLHLSQTTALLDNPSGLWKRKTLTAKITGRKDRDDAHLDSGKTSSTERLVCLFDHSSFRRFSPDFGDGLRRNMC